MLLDYCEFCFFMSGMISRVLILRQIRSVYRLIEFALGIQGYPFTHEWIFYVFESLPMLPAIAVFCVWHPAEYLGGGWRKGKGVGDVQLENSSGGTNV
jgi:hypothetical protein